MRLNAAPTALIHVDGVAAPVRAHFMSIVNSMPNKSDRMAVMEEYEERAAIVEYLGGVQSRRDAEWAAVKMVAKKWTGVELRAEEEIDE